MDLHERVETEIVLECVTIRDERGIKEKKRKKN